MAEWTSVEKGAKDEQGRYMALVGGQWRPAARVAKNDQGQYLALFDDAPGAAPAPKPPPEPRDVGFAESLGRTAGAAAIPVVRSLGMAAATVAGIFGRDAADRVFGNTDQIIDSMRRTYEPQEGETFNTAGSLAGGVLSAPVQMAGGMGLQHGVERAAQVVERGGSMGDAALAGGVSGGVNLGLNLLPMKVGGGVGRAIESKIGSTLTGAATGGAVAAGAAPVARAAENLALGEDPRYNDLRRDIAPTAPEVGLGMAFGAVPGAAGSPAVTAAVRKAKGQVKEAALSTVAKAVDVNPTKLANAEKAIEQGFQPGLHDIGDRGVATAVGDTMSSVPILSKNRENFDNLQRNIIRQIHPENTAAIDAKKPQVSTKVLNDALKAKGKTIGDNMAEVNVPSADLESGIAKIRDQLNTAADSTDAAVTQFARQFDKLVAENGTHVPGTALRELDTDIGKAIRKLDYSQGDLSGRLHDLQSVIRDASEAAMTPEKRAETRTARKQYAKAMSLVPAAKDIANAGHIDPAKFQDLTINAKAGRYLLARGLGGEWQDLGKSADLVAPGAGKARVTMGQRIGIGGGLAGVGGMAYLNPAAAGTAATVGGALAAAYNAASPRLVKALIKRERARNAPPEPPPEAPLTTTPGAGGESGPRGGTVLPPPQDGPLGPAGPDLTTSPGAGGIELPSELSPAEARLAGRLTPFDDQPLTEKPPRRIIKSDAPTVVSDAGPTRPRRPIVEAPVERRGLRAVPPVEGRPDLPPEMVAGGLADRPGQTPEVASNTTSGVTGAGKGVRATEGNPEAMRSEGAALGRRKIIEDRYAAAGGQTEPGNHPAPKPPSAEPAPAPADPRLAEIEALRAKADSPAVLAALKKREAAVRRTMAEEDAARQRETDAAALDDAARKAQDPETKALLKAEADKLREPIPAGETKEGFPPAPAEPRGKIPVGKTKEVPLPAAGRDGELQAPMPLPEVEELPVQRVEGGEPIPRGEATEVEPVPVGQADEMLPVGQADELVPTGEASEMLPTGEATEGPPPMAPAPKPRIIAPPGAPPGQPPMPPAPKPPPKGPPAAGGGKPFVAGKDGQPKVLYRAGSKAGKPTRSNTPYFAESEADARDYAATRKSEGYGSADTQVRKVNLRANKLATDADVERVAAAHGIDLPHPDYPVAYMERAPELVKALQEEGFDGAVGLDGRPSDGKEIRSYVVFDKGQVVDVAPAPAPAVKTYQGVDTRVIGGEAGQAREATEAADRAAKTAARKAETAGKSLTEIRAADHMNRDVRFNGEVMPAKAMMDRLLDQGKQPRVEMVDKVAPMSRKAFFRASNAEQRAHEARVKAEGKKPSYWVGGYEVSKTEHDYAVAQLEKRNAPQEKPQPASVQGEPQGRDEGRAGSEAGPGDRVQRAAEGEGQAPGTQVTDRAETEWARRTQAAADSGDIAQAARMAFIRDTGPLSFRSPADKTKFDALVAGHQKGAEAGMKAAANEAVVPEATNGQNAPKKRLIAPRNPESKPVNTPAELPKPEGTKPVGEPFYRGGKLVQAHGLFGPGDRVRAHDGGYLGTVVDLVSPDENGLVTKVGVKYDNGSTGVVSTRHLDPAEADVPAAPAPAAAAPKPAPAPAKPAPKPMIQSTKPSERLAELNRQIDERLPDAKAADDPDVMELAREQQAKPDEKMLKAKYRNGMDRDRARSTIQTAIDDRRERAARAIGKVTIKAGGTTYTVVNTQERLQALKAQIAKDPGFKDKPARPVTPRGTEDPVTAKRHPKTVVQDFVADGDFENAQALADHYGLDIKAGMDAKQKQAYQDWQDSKAP